MSACLIVSVVNLRLFLLSTVAQGGPVPQTGRVEHMHALAGRGPHVLQDLCACDRSAFHLQIRSRLVLLIIETSAIATDGEDA